MNFRQRSTIMQKSDLISNLKRKKKPKKQILNSHETNILR